MSGNGSPDMRRGGLSPTTSDEEREKRGVLPGVVPGVVRGEGEGESSNSAPMARRGGRHPGSQGSPVTKGCRAAWAGVHRSIGSRFSMPPSRCARDCRVARSADCKKENVRRKREKDDK